MKTPITDPQQIQFDKLPASLTSFKKILCDCINIEYLYRTSADEKLLLSSVLLELMTEFKIHTMFTKQGMEAIQDFVFAKHKAFRDFILSVTDVYFIEIRGNIQLSAKDYLPEEVIAEYLSKNIDNKRSLQHGKDNVLMPKEQFETLYFKGTAGTGITDSKHLFLNNDWLVVVTLAILCIHDITFILNQSSTE